MAELQTHFEVVIPIQGSKRTAEYRAYKIKESIEERFVFHSLEVREVAE